MSAPDSDLLKHGWAPGGYVINCVDCDDRKPFVERGEGDKRSWRCRPHALAIHNLLSQGTSE